MNKILVFFFFSVFLFSQKADLTSAILAFQKNDNVTAKEFIDIAYDKFMQINNLSGLSFFTHIRNLKNNF